MKKRGFTGPSLKRGLSELWAEHTRSFQPGLLVNEVHPKTVLPTASGALTLLLVMYFVPQARAFSGFDHPHVPIALLLVGTFVSLVQWRLWDRQRFVHFLCLVDNGLYILAIVAVMVDTTSPVRYVWALLYAQVAAHYGNRYSFSWPLLAVISVAPFGTALAFASADYGLVALTLFGAFMFVVNSTTTAHVRRVESEKERYRCAYEISDKVASESLDIALATSLAEFGNYAHELRNASTPILGNILILKEHEELDPDCRAAVESLERSHERNADLIEKLLASIKRRTVTGDMRFMLGEVLDPEVLGRGLVPADRRKLEVEGGALPLEISGNPEHLVGAIGNLIQNALDAGAGRVTVSATMDGSISRALITLADDGPGISEELVGSLFRPGARSGSGASHGLGLPLSKRLIEVLGGRLVLAETGSAGTVFEIVIAGRYAPRSEEELRQAG